MNARDPRDASLRSPDSSCSPCAAMQLEVAEPRESKTDKGNSERPCLGFAVAVKIRPAPTTASLHHMYYLMRRHSSRKNCGYPTISDPPLTCGCNARLRREVSGDRA